VVGALVFGFLALRRKILTSVSVHAKLLLVDTNSGSFVGPSVFEFDELKMVIPAFVLR